MTKRPGVDMSSAAIDRRLRELAQLYRLGKSLAQAQRLGTVERAAPPDESTRRRK